MIGIGLGINQNIHNRKWWGDTAVLAYEPANNRYMADGQILEDSVFDVTRASTAFAPDKSGQLIEFQPNEPRITDKGLFVSPSSSENGVTTAADIVSCDSIATTLTGMSAWILVLGMDILAVPNSGYPVFLDIGDVSGGTERISFLATPTSDLLVLQKASGVDTYLSLGQIEIGRLRIALGFDGGELSVKSTTSVYSAKAVSPANLAIANIGSRLGGSAVTTVNCKVIKIIDENPTAARLQELSTL